MRKALGALALAALAAGCATSPTSTPIFSRAPAVPRLSPADQLLAALARLKAMDEVTLASEVARSRGIAEATPTDLANLEAALALAVWPPAEDAEILARLTPVLREAPPAAPEMRAMAGFLQGMVLERRKLRESATAAAAKSRDDRRDALAQKQRADAQQERADRLQQKLEALTNLEKSLSNRKHADDPARRPR
ncbi:MAG: hypothetical protein IPJ28_16065 [Betaproteobacteria bacterium]|nr:hypothetical protein [Betaproteobacteria bacterium]